MKTRSDRFELLGTTEYAHEREALDFIGREFPHTEPFHGRGLVDLLDPSSGRRYEIDAIIVGYAAVYVVEIKSHPGRIAGDAHGWLWTPPGATRARDLDNPYALTNHKAKVVGSLLRRHLGNLYEVPWVQPLIFLSAEDLQNHLDHEGKVAVVTRETLFRALKFGEFPGADARRLGRPINGPAARAIRQAFDKMGLRPRKTLLQVGDYVLGPVTEDGEAYQDREARHAQFEDMVHRARVYLVPEQTTIEHKQRLLRAAEREVRLLWSVRDNPNILSSHYYAPDGPLGPTLVFEDFEGALRLDRFLARHPDLPFDDRVELLRQVGHALHFCHRRNVTHGGLSPEAVLVRRVDDEIETRLFNFQLGRSEDASATVHRTAFVSRTAGAYQAPELITDPAAGSAVSDVFSLAALAYFIFTGHPPAANLVELQQRLHRERCLDPSVVTDDLPDAVIELVRNGTSVAPGDRIDNAMDFVELLVAELRPEVVAAPQESTADVLEADTGDILVERFEVKRVLGHGASARVLQVAADDADGRTRLYALKASRGPDHDDRIRQEGELLQRLRHARIVECHEVLTISARTCLLLSLAGERSLQQAIAEQGSLDLDLASRYGEDLLDALKALEDEGVFHRDIKPANLGVGSRGKMAKHLTLFDFSLLGTSVSDLETGTAPYRDPFLALRGAWDHPADRWSAAVTLHEMLTGLRPRYGRPGQSALDPKADLVLESERFDAGLRDRLIAFFRQALAREPEERFASATAMARAWASCFDARPRPVADDANTEAAGRSGGPRKARGGPVELGPITDAQLARIQPDTPIRALPLSARAHNALDRAGLTRAEELLALPDNRLSAIRGIGSKVAREIFELRNAWVAKRDRAATATEAFFPEYRGPEIAVDALDVPDAAWASLSDAGLRTAPSVAQAPRAQVHVVLRRCGVAPEVVTEALAGICVPPTDDRPPASLGAWLDGLFPARGKADRVRHLYGLEAPFEGRCDLTLADVATNQGTSVPRLQQQQAEAIARWHAHPWGDALRTSCLEGLRTLGGAAPLEHAAQALAATIPDDLRAPEPLRTAQYAALLRVATELGPDEAGDRVLLGRRERRTRAGTHDTLWVVAGDEASWTAIKALGDLADALAQREPLASTGETERALAELASKTPQLAALDPDRRLTLAAAASLAAARSTRLELYPVGMPAARALDLSAQALSGEKFKADELRDRVHARYPEAEPLPGRPALDALVAPLGFSWDEATGLYRRPQADTTGSTHVTSLHRHATTYSGARPLTEESTVGRDFEDSLVGVVQDRKLRVLAVNGAYLPEAVAELERVLQTTAVALDRRLAEQMEAYLAQRNGAPEVLWKADAEGPAGPHWPRLLTVAQEAARRLAETLLPAQAPLLLVQAGLLARYQLREFVQRLVEASQADETPAIVLVNPTHAGGRDDVLNDTLPIPGLLPGETGRIPRAWIENKHRGSVTAH